MLFGWLTDSSLLDYGLSGVVITGGSILSAMYLFQTRLIYLPQLPPGARTTIWLPSQFGFSPKHDEEVILKSSDGIQLHGYWLSDAQNDNSNDLPTFIYFQGNAGNIGHRLPILRKLHATVPCNTFIISYRGFGRSEGIPDERGIRLDAQAALDYVLSRADVCKEKIVLYGQSIGGAVAIDLAARNQSKIWAIVLENTFLSLHKLIPHVMPWIGWANRLCHQKWDSEERMREMVSAADSGANLPNILFLSGSKDLLVPPYHMAQLFGIASEANKSSIVLAKCPDGDHVNTCMQPEYFPAISNFIAQIEE